MPEPFSGLANCSPPSRAWSWRAIPAELGRLPARTRPLLPDAELRQQLAALWLHRQPSHSPWQRPSSHYRRLGDDNVVVAMFNSTATPGPMICVQVFIDRDDLETGPLEQWRRSAPASRPGRHRRHCPASSRVTRIRHVGRQAVPGTSGGRVFRSSGRRQLPEIRCKAGHYPARRPTRTGPSYDNPAKLFNEPAGWLANEECRVDIENRRGEGVDGLGRREASLE